MTKQLSGSDVEYIVQIIDNLDDVSWKCIVAEVAFHLRRTYTRQALSKYQRIVDARQLRLKATRDRSPIKTSPRDIQYLSERLKALNSENERLKFENNQLLEQFARWAKNAYARGIPLSELDNPPLMTTARNG